MSYHKVFSPLKVNCFHCQKSFAIKYVQASGDYSSKNNWGYWTEKPVNKENYICDDCLVKLYQQCKWEFKKLIANSKKQTLLRQYIANGTIKGKIQTMFI